MAHKLLSEDVIEKKKVKRFTLPSFSGKFGFSVFVGQKEVFIGLQVGEVEIERITRRKILKTPKAGVRVFKFDSL